MSLVFSDTERDFLRAPHVCELWLGRFDFIDGVQHLHSGEGNFTDAEGQTWQGVCDPINGPLVMIGDIEEQRLGQASSIDLVLAGVDLDFVQKVMSNADANEGRSVDLFWAGFDAETQTIGTRMVPIFPLGRMSAPFVHVNGLKLLAVGITVEGIFSSTNFATGGRWNPADQQRRHPGDTIFDQVGLEKTELWQ